MNGLKVLIVGVLALFLGACQQKTDNTAGENTIRIGTVVGPDAQLLEVAKNVAKEKYNLDVHIIQFSNYNLPNEALEDGMVDINLFQHIPYLAAWKAQNDVNDLVPVAKTFIYPMGIYSYKINNMGELPNNALVAIPNDPTNQARALLLLQTAKLIRLKSEANVTAKIDDIISNPKHLRFIQADPAQLAKLLPSVTIIVINCNYAVAAGLLPIVNRDPSSHNDALYLESADSLYTNVFVVKAGHEDDMRVRELIAAFQSSQVWAAAQSIFHNSAIKAW